MPPPGASAPAFVATVEPASMQERVLRNGLHPASILDFRPELGNRCRVLPVYALMRASILDFKPRLANRCKLFPVYPLLRASILDFKPKLANRCRVLPVYTIFRASILDFRPRFGNRCRVLPVYTIFRASILDFRPRLANRCSVIAAAVRNGPPATAVVAAIFRVRFYSSLPQRRMARRQRPWRRRVPRPILIFVASKEIRN